MEAEEIVELNRTYTFFTWSVQSQVHPIPVSHGQGAYFWDVTGKRYLDFSSQLMNLNAGFGNKRIIRAIQEQAERLAFAWPGFATEPRGRLGQLLAEITPGSLCKTLFTTGGGEANENAIKFARLVTGRHKILARYRSFHGATAGALALTGDPYRHPVEPLIPGVVHFLDPYCYRCPFGWTRETCHRECIDHVEHMIQLEGPDHIAGIVLEGVTGSNGIIIPPDEYWPRIREMCDRYGILLIDDEVMSGFGRTGKWFAVEHWGVAPDIMTMGKGITSGYVPLGAVIVSKPIAEYFDNRRLPMGLTNNSHPVCVAAGVAAIEAYQADGLIENARHMGNMLKEGLEELKEKHPSIGDVRSIGLFACIELVKDRETKEPLSPLPGLPPSGDPMLAAKLSSEMRKRGMHCFAKWNYIFPIPPLCVGPSELQEGLAILDEVLVLADEIAAH
ncbi:MAG: aminotransferase class III-fold pyridoxal phosphate-dependent enzyme [Anaerolineae bacterium]|nr:aminotransferase class III-fold pyridoxal phosphate-dependent enzyme [Anaerolineae bacterium]